MKLLKIREVKTTEGKIITNEIKLSENELFRIYAIHKGLTLERGLLLEEIIKVSLPDDEEEAKKMLKEGIKIDKILFTPLLTSPSLMKHSEDESEIYDKTKCDYLFTSNTTFKEEMQKVASLGKITDKKDKEININKDIISRLGLLTSSSQSVKIEDYTYCVLPEMKYTYKANYLQFAEKEVLNNKGETIKVIDLEKALTEKMQELMDLEVEHTMCDGCGFMMPSFADKIKVALKMEHKLDFITFRQTGMASKGLLVRFDHKNYLKKEYGLTELIVKDYWGNNVDLFKVSVVMNESQIKWCKWFKSQEEMETLKANFPEYLDLLNSIGVMKTNREAIEDYFLSNYQIMSNLALTKEKIAELGEYTKNLYRRVANKEADAIRLMLGDIKNDDTESLNATTKAHRLIQVREHFKESGFAKQIIESLLNKNVNLLAGSKMYLKGSYRMVCQDPLSYFDIIAKGEVINGLKPKTNYIKGEKGNRVLARCPLNNATEIIKTELVNSPKHNKYIDVSNEIIFLALDNNAMIASGMDTDGDIIACIDEETIYEAVIEDIDSNGVIWNFRNQFDGGKGDMKEYNDDNEIECILLTRGNSIGGLSNIGARISNICQSNLYKNKNDIYFTIKEVFNAWQIKKKDDYDEIKQLEYSLIQIDRFNYDIKNHQCYYTINGITYEDEEGEEMAKESIRYNEEKVEILKVKVDKLFKNDLQELFAKGSIVDYKTLSEDVRKQTVIDAFKQYKRKEYYTTFLQMVAIDSVKTSISVTPEQESLLKVYKKMMNPKYINHAKYKKNKTPKQKAKLYDYEASVLNDFATDVISELGANVRKDKKYNDKVFKDEIKSDIEGNDDLKQLLEDFILVYNIERKKVSSNLSKDERREAFNIIDALLQAKFDREIVSEYKAEEICNEFIKITDSRMVVKFAFEQALEVLLKESRISSIYEEDEKGTIEFKHKKYIKEEIEISYDNLTKKEVWQKINKIGVKTRITKLTGGEITELIYVVNSEMFNSEAELIGKLAPDDKWMIDDGDYHVISIDMKPKSCGLELMAM